MPSRELIFPAIAFLMILLIWEAASHSFEAHQFVLPAPTAIVSTLWERSDRFLYHATATLSEMVGGFILAFAAAFPLGWMMCSWKSARQVLQPLFVAIQCIPMFALAPIMVLWFGWGYTAIVIPTALMIFFPLTMNIYQGFQSTPKQMIEYFTIQEATPWQLFTKLQIPWALPYIFAGFRISAAIAGIGAVAGEWAGAQKGLGMLMLESRRATDLEMTFGALIVLAALSLSLYGLIALLERRFTTHRPFSEGVKRMAVALAMMGIALGSCNTQPEPHAKTRMLLDWLPNPNHVPLFVGMEKGFFADNGVHLDLLKLQDPADSMPYLCSGQADLVLYYTPDAVRSNARGCGVVPVGILIKQPLNALIFRRGEGIEKPEDLNGKVIGYCVDGTSTATLDHLLSSNDIRPSAKRNVNFDLVSTLGTNQVDAIYGAYWNIECEHLRALGIETDHFDMGDLGFPHYYELIVLAKEKSLAASPAFIEAFKRALQQSIDYCTEHPDEAFSIYATANPDKAGKTLEWEARAWQRTIPTLAESQTFDPDLWNGFAVWLYDHDLLGR